jgi:adenosylcobinamide amidohydrolase
VKALELADSAVLMTGVQLSRSGRCVRVNFAKPHRALSSAVLNGGYCLASNYLNVRVDKHGSGSMEDPALSLQRVSDQLQCSGVSVGMMTAASLDSLRVVCESIGGEELAVVVTTGMENARRAGDSAEYRSLEVVPIQRGTINLAVITSAQVADEALVEMVTVATEAKVATLHELDIKSPVSGELATGTGTDAIAIFSGHGRHQVRFAGKHMLLGERLAVMVMQAVHSSIDYMGSSPA